MSMARDPIRSRPINIAEAPRPVVPSRTSSLKYTSPGSTYGKGNFNCVARLAKAKTPAETQASSWGSWTPNATHHNLIAEDGNPLKFLSGPSNSVPTRSYSLRCTPISVKAHKKAAGCTTKMRTSTRAGKIKRWAGHTRTSSDWDGLRRDPELWFDHGDCLIHLYARGQSRRGPSFCVPFDVLRNSKCGAMFSLCFAQMTGHPSKRLSSGFSTPITETNNCELYIPAPEDASREDSFQWHITTRNFFAFLFGKPLVGNHMGKAFIELQERMNLFRSGRVNNHKEFLDYAESQGYRDFVDCPDYALATLYYAEHFQLRDIWIDAFAHCVGMNENLILSAEFASISRITKALITRAYLEMDIHLSRVTVAISNFLEDDMSPAFLGLGEGARTHLDRFRSFLHGFYVEKFGYWPPPKGTCFSKALYKSMYYDFKNMYDYLVDMDSTYDLASQKPASGGICVLQNVGAFDNRHDFVPLPHPLPLMPNHIGSSTKTQSQKTLRTLTLGSKQAKTDRYMTTRAALTAATNTRDISVTSSALVQAYMRFERQCALNQREEKVSMADARKVRWLLIYGTLQYLISAVRAPKEVRESEEPTYPLCCLVTEKSPWEVGTKVLNSPGVLSVDVSKAINGYLSESSCTVPNELSPGAPKASTIQPDCQNEDYFTHTNPNSTRPVSVEVPAPLRISTSLVRNSSVRSFKHRSLSALSSRRNSIVIKAPTQPFCEIMVHGYGNGLNETVIDPPSTTVSRSGSISASKRSSGSTIPNGAEPQTSWLHLSTSESTTQIGQIAASELDISSALQGARTPVFDSFEFDNIASPVTPDETGNAPSSSNSTTSVNSAIWSDGTSSVYSQSSTEATETKFGSAEESGLLGGLVSVDCTPTSSPKKSSKTVSPTTPSRRGEFRFSFNNSSPEIGLTFTHLADSPISDISDSAGDIGVAYSEPPTPMGGSFHFDHSPALSETPSILPLSQSVSNESLPLAPSPFIKATSSTNSRGKGAEMDIFAALSLAPVEPEPNLEAELSRIASEASREMEAAIPPPIMKKASQIFLGKVTVEEAKANKKEKRKSFGFMLRRK